MEKGEFMKLWMTLSLFCLAAIGQQTQEVSCNFRRIDPPTKGYLNSAIRLASRPDSGCQKVMRSEIHWIADVGDFAVFSE